MRKNWLKTCGALGVLVIAPAVMAADHLDGAEVKKDPASDITDLYTWLSADGAKTYLVLNVSPVAKATATDAGAASKFSDAVQYVFHTTSKGTYSSATGTPLNIICTFDAAQTISCWAGSEYVHGSASGTAGLASSSGKLKVFAGPRDDPFFFNLDGFKKAAATVTSAKGTLAFNSNGCPTVDGLTSSRLVKELSTDPNADSGPAKDFFVGLNVLSIVVEIDTALLNTGGPIVGVWASTNKAL